MDLSFVSGFAKKQHVLYCDAKVGQKTEFVK